MKLFKNKNFDKESSWFLILIATLLFIIGIKSLFDLGFFTAMTTASIAALFKANIFKSSFAILELIGSFFTWVFLDKNCRVTRERDTVYLLKSDMHYLTFVDSKGRGYRFKNNNNNYHYQEGVFYDVIRNQGTIKDIIGVSKSKFALPSDVDSYFTYFYTPFNDYNGIYALPVLCTLLVPGIIISISSMGFERIYGLLLSMIPAYFIIYDLLQKENSRHIKKSIKAELIKLGIIKTKTDKEKDDEKNLKNSMTLFAILTTIIIIMSFMSQIGSLVITSFFKKILFALIVIAARIIMGKEKFYKALKKILKACLVSFGTFIGGLMILFMLFTGSGIFSGLFLYFAFIAYAIYKAAKEANEAAAKAAAKTNPNGNYIKPEVVGNNSNNSDNSSSTNKSTSKSNTNKNMTAN